MPTSIEAPVLNARPTVRIDGRPSKRVSGLLLAMEFREREGGPSAMELRFSNVATDDAAEGDLAFEDGSVLKLGAGLAVFAGNVGAPVEIFRGVVTGLEAEFGKGPPPELVVLAEDALQAARMTRRTVIYADATLKEIAEEIAQRLNLRPVVTGFTGDIGTRVQLNETDLGFLQRLLAAHDGDVQVVAGELHVSPRTDVERGVLELDMGAHLRRVRFLADLAHQATEVTVAGWDPLKGSRVTGASRGLDDGPGRGKRGSALVEELFGARSEHIGHLVASTRDEALALASAAFDRRARGFVTVRGTSEGDPALRVGTHVRITGVGPRFENTYYVTEACHRFDEQRGYECDFRAESAFLGGST